MISIHNKLLSFGGILLASLLLTSQVVSAQGQYVTGSTGVDVSWPNCSTSVPKVVFGIVGVTNGAGYSTSPCLAQEVTHFPLNLSLYVNTGWYNQSSHINATSPKVCNAGDNNCLAYNYGYNAGEYAYNAASVANVHSSSWWLDVETSNTWNNDVVQNQNSLQGEHDSLLSHRTITVGVYSTTAQWQTITGGWQNNWPSWGATTWTTATQAKTYCTGHQFTGGPSYLMQFISKKVPLDQDVAC
jgi:hypothetical protein